MLCLLVITELNLHLKVIVIGQFFNEKNYLKIDMFRYDVLTFWLLSCFAFYIVPNCISIHHTKFEIDRTILTYLN